MSKLRPPAFHDIARMIGRDADETEANLYSYYTNPFGAFFNYRRSQVLSRFAFGRMLPLEQILQGCQAERTEQGKNCNTEVLRLLWERSANRSVKVFTLAPKYLNIRKDLNIRVSPPFYFVEGEKAYVFWLQPRKGFAYNVGQLGLLASMVKATFLRDDFREVGFELCDMSGPEGKDREPHTYHLESLNIISEDETREKLQLFAIAYDRCVARGVERSKRAPREQPPSGPDLFPET